MSYPPSTDTGSYALEYDHVFIIDFGINFHFFSSVPIPSEAYHLLWERAITLANRTFVEGYDTLELGI